MMFVDHQIDHEAKLIVTTCIGAVTEDELISALKKYQETIQNHRDYVDYNEVLIFPEVSSVKVTVKGIRTIAAMAIASDQPDTKRRLSIAVQSKMGYGIAKMYQAYRLMMKSKKKVRVFRSVKAALEWAKK